MAHTVTGVGGGVCLRATHNPFARGPEPSARDALAIEGGVGSQVNEVREVARRRPAEATHAVAATELCGGVVHGTPRRVLGGLRQQALRLHLGEAGAPV